MTRRTSGVILVLYWVLLVFVGLAALGVTVAMATTGVVKAAALPTWAILGLSYGVPILIGWRIWVLTRARRVAAPDENFDTEQEDG